jgi:hypothetical protein
LVIRPRGHSRATKLDSFRTFFQNAEAITARTARNRCKHYTYPQIGFVSHFFYHPAPPKPVFDPFPPKNAPQKPAKSPRIVKKFERKYLIL